MQGVLPIILLLLTFSETSLTASFAQPANDCSSYFLQSNSPPPRHNSGRFSSDTGTLTMDPSRVIFHLLSQIFLLFTPYYRNLATFDLLSRRCSQFPRRSKKQAVALLLTHTHTPLKRIIYTGQVWDQSNLCGTIEYTNLRSDVSLAEGEAS